MAVLSLLVGCGVGVIYGVVNVRSPAPPVVALLGLLGMVIGEEAVLQARVRWTATAGTAASPGPASVSKPGDIATSPPPHALR
jgi:XapX domain-containing protein